MNFSKKEKFSVRVLNKLCFSYWKNQTKNHREKMSGTQEEDKKPGDQSAHINLKVKGQVLFSIIHLGFRVFVFEG